MTVLTLAAALSTSDLLAACATLGVRRPLGLSEAMKRHPSSIGPHRAVALSEDTTEALVALAAPEAIALVERLQDGTTSVVHVAVRGPIAAVHRVRGDHHVVERYDAEDAADQLLLESGLSVSQAGPGGSERNASVVDVGRDAFDRMSELVALNDLPRAAAALEADGAPCALASNIVAAARADAVQLLGLRNCGRRYEGCELSWIGQAERWLVPLPERSADTGMVLRRHAGPRHLRVEIEPVAASWLIREIAALFD